jgi:hypothetical protein
MKQKHSIILGGRPFTATVIAKHWKRICRHYGGLFVTSAGLLDAMHQLGISYTLDGTKLKKANSIGDLLGSKHFNLPSSGTGKRSYYLPAIEMTEEERLKFAALEPDEMLAEIEAVTAKLRADDGGGQDHETNQDLAA